MVRRSVLILLLLLVITPLLGAGRTGADSLVPTSSATWESLGLTTANVRTIAVDPDRPSNIYAGGEDPSRAAADFFQSGDAGLSWHDRSLNGSPYLTYNVALDSSVQPHLLYASSTGAILRSADNGVTWTKISRGGFYQIAFDPVRQGWMYTVSGVNSASRSTDGGHSWQPMTVATVRLCDYGAVAVAPSRPSTVYLGGGCGVFRSTDRGATWQPLPGAPVGADAIVVDPRDAAHLYVGIATSLPRFCLCPSYPLWESHDAGQTWHGIADGYGARALLLDPRDPDVLYLANGAPYMRWSRDGGATWHNLGGPLPAIPLGVEALAFDNGSLLAGGRGGIWRLALPAPHDARYFPQTGYRIDNDTIWDYFQRRGGLTAFGYPTSRTFTFQGFTVQFFQRRIVKLDQNGNPLLLHLLDPGLLNYTSFNGSTFPSVDSGLVSTAPDPTNQPAVLAWVQQHAPDTVGSNATNFFHTFSTTVSAQTAFPNGGDASLLPGIELELWGIPTSQPMIDPNNHNFISLRWQRGIMLYDASCNCTQGILLADYLKAILTGQHLPPDLAQEAATSRFLDQYDPDAPHWVHSPGLLPDTDLTNAFTQE